MFFIISGTLIGIMVFILVENKRENFGFAFMQILFFPLLGFFLSLFLSYNGFAPTINVLADTIYLEELSPNVYLELEENTSYDKILKENVTNDILTYKDKFGIHKNNQLDIITINVNIQNDDIPYVKIYKKQFVKDYYKYFFFNDSQKEYEFNLNMETYESLNLQE